METAEIELEGRHIRLEPLAPGHVPELTRAAAGNQELYRWSPVPQGEAAMAGYVATALAWKAAGTALPFAIVRLADGALLGSTRFWNLERWAWPEGHPGTRRAYDGCEIGYTWLTAAAIRTAANTEAKLLMLTQAFERWGALRVCLHTDARNARSRAAIARIGGAFEGILRAHRLAADLTPRDSARFSILAAGWPEARARLIQSLER